MHLGMLQSNKVLMLNILKFTLKFGYDLFIGFDLLFYYSRRLSLIVDAKVLDNVAILALHADKFDKSKYF